MAMRSSLFFVFLFFLLSWRGRERDGGEVKRRERKRKRKSGGTGVSVGKVRYLMLVTSLGWGRLTTFEESDDRWKSGEGE